MSATKLQPLVWLFNAGVHNILMFSFFHHLDVPDVRNKNYEKRAQSAVDLSIMPYSLFTQRSSVTNFDGADLLSNWSKYLCQFDQYHSIPVVTLRKRVVDKFHNSTKPMKLHGLKMFTVKRCLPNEKPCEIPDRGQKLTFQTVQVLTLL